MFFYQRLQMEPIPLGYQNLELTCRPYESGEPYLLYISRKCGPEQPLQTFTFQEFIPLNKRWVRHYSTWVSFIIYLSKIQLFLTVFISSATVLIWRKFECHEVKEGVLSSSLLFNIRNMMFKENLNPKLDILIVAFSKQWCDEIKEKLSNLICFKIVIEY